MEVKSGTVTAANPLPTEGAAAMTMKLNFDLFDMCHYHDCVHVLHTLAAVTRLQSQLNKRSAWKQIPTFHLSTYPWIQDPSRYSYHGYIFASKVAEILHYQNLPWISLPTPVSTQRHQYLTPSSLPVSQSEASTPARTKRLDNHNKTHILLCDCFGTAANQPSGAAYLFTKWKSIQRHLEALHFRTNVSVSRELSERTQKSKYRMRLLYFTELPQEVFPWSDKVKQTHAVNVFSLWLLPAVGSDADCICSLIQ